MARFRPNIVVDAAAVPWAEDGWRRLVVGSHGVALWGVKRCSRCKVTTIDQATGAAPPPAAPGEELAEPLRTLATFRADDRGDVFFALNLMLEAPALGGGALAQGGAGCDCTAEGGAARELRVGDAVRVAEVGNVPPAARARWWW